MCICVCVCIYIYIYISDKAGLKQLWKANNTANNKAGQH